MSFVGFTFGKEETMAKEGANRQGRPTSRQAAAAG